MGSESLKYKDLDFQKIKILYGGLNQSEKNKANDEESIYQVQSL